MELYEKEKSKKRAKTFGYSKRNSYFCSRLETEGAQ